MVSFGEPAFLWLLTLPAAGVVLVLLRHTRRVLQQRQLASPAVWDRLLGGAPATGLVRLLGWCVAGACTAVALARPQWGEIPQTQSIRARDLVLAVDVSDSMLCPDIRPSRLERSLELIHRVLPAFAGNRVAVLVFAGEAYPVVPLTTDLEAASSFLETIHPGMIGLPGSNLQEAVAAGLKLLPPEGEGRVVVLFSDGENLQGDLKQAATSLKEAGVGLLAVVAGTEQGGPIPMVDENGSLHYKKDKSGKSVVSRARRDQLEEVANMVAGEVVDLGDRDAAQNLVRAVEAIRTREVEATQRVERVERFPLFLTGAIVALIASFLASPWRRRVATAMLAAAAVVGGVVQAQEPTSVPGGDKGGQTQARQADVPDPPWWQRFIPGGSRRLARRGAARWAKGDVEGASRAFEQAAALDPENAERLFDLGTALAVGGDLPTGAAVLQKADQAGVEGAAYNAGTASLGGGQAEPAVEWLRRAVLTDPDDPDAKRNFELALRLLEQQQQQQSQDDSEKNDDEKKEDEKEQEQQQGDATPTPSPSQGSGPPPTPTPNPSSAVYAALDRAEAEAREAMRSPTPQSVTVDKDW
jgi:Ca-activated chloride channel family protein